MSKQPNYFKLGVFVILACLLLAGFLIAFGAGNFFQKELTMETCFDESVQGLEMGSEVKYKGVRIGRVQEITTATHKYGVSSDYVLVIFTVEENAYTGQKGKSVRERMEQAIAKGLKVRLSFKGVTGVAFLEMDYAGNDKDHIEITWKPKYLYMPSQKSQMASIGEALTNIMDNLGRMEVDGIAQNFEKLLETLEQKAQGLDTKAISSQMNAFLQEIRTTNNQISKVIDSNEVQDVIGDARDSFSSMKQILDTVETSLSSALEDLSQATGNASQITENLNKGLLGQPGALSSRIGQLMDSLNRTADMLETIVWTNSDAVEKMAADFSKSAENLNQFINELRYYPGRIFLEKSPEPYEKGKDTQKNE